MKKLIIILLAAVLPFAAKGQITYSDPVTDLGARLNVGVDKKMAKGLHMEVWGEARTADNFSAVGRFDAGLGMTYKFNDIFKVGTGYVFINKLSDSGNWKMRHRVYVDGKATLDAGSWRFSLKERLQLTHKDVNTVKHQTTPNLLELKSRVKAAYRGFDMWTPYAYLELRNVFNDPASRATWSSASQTFGDYEFLGYTHAYVNRLRGSIGTELKLDKHNAFDLYLLTDWCKDKKTDTAHEGTVLKSLTWERTLYGAVCLGYKFSF